MREVAIVIAMAEVLHSVVKRMVLDVPRVAGSTGDKVYDLPRRAHVDNWAICSDPQRPGEGQEVRGLILVVI